MKSRRRNSIIAVSALVAMITLSAHAQEEGGKNPAKDTQRSVTKIIASIVGKWELQEIDQAKHKQKMSKDTTGMEWIEFRPDGRYTFGSNGKAGAVQAIDSGSYRLNEQNGILYLQSSLNSESKSHKPVEWSIAIKDKAMTLTGRTEEHIEGYQFKYAKVKEGLGKK